MDFDYKQIIKKSININGKTDLKMRFGLDFGYSNDVAALIACIVDEKNMRIWIFDEFYKVGQTNMMLADMIRYKGFNKEVIRCDSAEPKSIDELKYYGINRAVASLKGKDSIRQGISRLQDYKIIVHSSMPFIYSANISHSFSHSIFPNFQIDDKPIRVISFHCFINI